MTALLKDSARRDRLITHMAIEFRSADDRISEAEKLLERKAEPIEIVLPERKIMEPEKETDALLPQNPYGISKRAGEELLMNLGRRYGIASVALRFSIVLGPRQSFKHFYSGALRAFSVNVLSGDPIKMNEDGKQTRDYIHVSDIVRFIQSAIKTNNKQSCIFSQEKQCKLHSGKLCIIARYKLTLSFRQIKWNPIYLCNC